MITKGFGWKSLLISKGLGSQFLELILKLILRPVLNLFILTKKTLLVKEKEEMALSISVKPTVALNMSIKPFSVLNIDLSFGVE